MRQVELIQKISQNWLEEGTGRVGPFLSDIQKVILTVIGGELEALSRENERLAAKLDRLERKVRRLDPERAGSTICGHED